MKCRKCVTGFKQNVNSGLFITPLYLNYCNGFTTGDDGADRTIFNNPCSLILVEENV